MSQQRRLHDHEADADKIRAAAFDQYPVLLLKHVSAVLRLHLERKEAREALARIKAADEEALHKQN